MLMGRKIRRVNQRRVNLHNLLGRTKRYNKCTKSSQEKLYMERPVEKELFVVIQLPVSVGTAIPANCQ